MTRKEFELIARALHEVRNSYAPHWDANLFRACDDHAKKMADLLATTNTRFNRTHFLNAAGVQS